MENTTKVSAIIGGKEITIETGLLARQAAGSVTVRLADTVLFSAVCHTDAPREGIDYFPLQVDYREKFYAAGMYPGGFFKRETRPSDHETLIARLTDRPIRPLFPEGYYNDVQVMNMLLSADGENDPDVLSVTAASASLHLSEVPFYGPIAAVRIGRIKGEWVINPTQKERQESDLDLMYAGTRDRFLMMEGGADEIPEADFIAAMKRAQEEVVKLIDIQIELSRMLGKPDKVITEIPQDPEKMDFLRAEGAELRQALMIPGKLERQGKVDEIKAALKAKVMEKWPEFTDNDFLHLFDAFEIETVRSNVLDHNHRIDGRGQFEIRPLSAEVVRTFANGLKLTQTFALPEDNYMVECKYVWTNMRSEPITVHDLGVRLAGLPQVKDLTGDKIYSERMNVDFCKVGSGMCDSADPQVKSDEKFERKTTCTEPVAWIGSSNKYFASLLFADEAMPFASSNGDRIWRMPAGSNNEKDLYAVPSMTGNFGTVTFAPGVPVEFTLKTYCGPKEMARIRALGPSVMGVMHISYYSWFEFIASPMVMLLNWLKSLCGSYGIAIILLTLIVRILFWPITQKANSSMRRMQKLQPKIKELQEKYKETPMDTPDDTARKKAELNQKMMELYRVEKVNPVGGCLPILLQIPVFIALYSALDSAVELRNVPFLWCTDLSRPDLVGPTLPFALPFIGQVGFHPLVIAMTALMVLQQKMTPTTGDSAQQKMMMLMPVIMLFFFYNFPSGLALYWTVNNVLSIIQMKISQYSAKRDEARQTSKPQKA